MRALSSANDLTTYAAQILPVLQQQLLQYGRLKQLRFSFWPYADCLAYDRTCTIPHTPPLRVLRDHTPKHRLPSLHSCRQANTGTFFSPCDSRQKQRAMLIIGLSALCSLTSPGSASVLPDGSLIAFHATTSSSPLIRPMYISHPTWTSSSVAP